MTKFLRAAILGAPASGKGTISSKIVNNFDIIHVSTGDIFRQIIDSKTEIAQSLQRSISSGKLVSDDLVIKIVLDKLKELEKKNWLCDGFPRTRQQAEKLFTEYPLDVAINLEVPVEVIIERVVGRWVHVPSGRVYNTEFNAPKTPGKDDVTGEPLVQRTDDKPEAILERLRIYRKNTGPLVDFYKEKGILREFRGKTSKEMWPPIEKTLLEFLKPKS